MEENISKGVFILMQKIVDKLDAISKDINEKNKTELNDDIKKNNGEIKKAILLIIKNQIKIKESTIAFENKIKRVVLESRTTPTVNNYTEYSLFGSNSHFTPKKSIIILFSIITVWCSFKYIPSVITENSTLKKEKKEYEIFYNYVYLKEFKQDKISIPNEILKKVKQKDSLFMKEYHTLKNTYQRKIRMEELKKELNSLDNNDS